MKGNLFLFFILLFLHSFFCYATTTKLNDTTTEMVQDITYYTSDFLKYGFMVRVNISSLDFGGDVAESKLCLYWQVGSGIDTDANISRTDNQTWDESLSGSGFNDMTFENFTSTEEWTSTTAYNWGCIDVTTQVSEDYSLGNDYTSLRLEDIDYPIDTTGFIIDDGYLHFGDHEGASSIANDRENTYGTGIYNYLNVTVDLANPTYTILANNGSDAKVNNKVNFSVKLSDDEYLDYYIFAHNQTGTLTNVSPVDISDVHEYTASSELTITSTRGESICGMFWFNDTVGNTNSTNLTCFTVQNTYPSLTTDLIFTNASKYHNFNVTSVFRDLDGTTDFINMSIEVSSGTCQYLKNTTSGDDMTLKYNCSGTALTSTQIKINITDFEGETATSTTISNTYPNNAPTISGAELNKTTGVVTTNDLNCTISNPQDLDDDAITNFYEWYKDSIAQGLNSENLSSSHTSDGEDWYCEAWVGDTYENSSKYTSTTVSIGTTNSAPIISDLNATTSSTGINSTAINPTNNNSWINLTINFTDTNSNEKWTAYFCNTPNFATCKANASNEVYCQSGANVSLTTLSCQLNVSGLTSSTYTVYGFVEDNASLSSVSKQIAFNVNHPPTLATLVEPSPNSYVTVNWTLINFSSIDSDADTINISIFNSTDGVNFSQLNIGPSVYNWTNLVDGTYYIRAYSVDNHGYSNLINSSVTNFTIDTSPPIINSLTPSATSIVTTGILTLNADLTDLIGFSATACEFTVRKSNQNLGAGIGNEFNFTSTTKAGSLVQGGFVASTFSVGTLEWTKVYCSDISGLQAENLTVGINISVTTPPVAGSPGGGGGDDPLDLIQAVEAGINASIICGNGICQVGENPLNCVTDCAISIDELICPIFGKDCPAWAFNWALYIILGAVIVVVYRKQTRGRK